MRTVGKREITKLNHIREKFLIYYELIFDALISK
jgi:hypothetical protein